MQEEKESIREISGAKREREISVAGRHTSVAGREISVARREREFSVAGREREYRRCSVSLQEEKSALQEGREINFARRKREFSIAGRYTSVA